MIDFNTKLKILVVEDNPGDLLLLEELLFETNISIQEIKNVTLISEAKNILNSYDFDLIFLDLSLADSSGLDSFKDLYSITEKVPIIVLTGLKDSSIAISAIVNGAQDFLVKGEFDAKLLAKTMQYSIERKKNLENLRESNARYDLVVEATHEAVWDWNFAQDDLLWVGKGFNKIFGYEYANTVIPFQFWEECLHPEDKVRVIEKLQTSILNLSNHSWEDEYRFRDINGNYLYVLDRGYTLFDSENNPVRMIGAMQNITAKKLAEEELKKLSLIAKETVNAVIIASKKGEIQWVNEAFTKLSQFTVKESIGSFVQEMIFSKDTDKETISYLLEKVEKDLSFECVLLTRAKDGQNFWMKVLGQPIADEKGKVLRYFAIGTDITRQKEAEETIINNERRYRALIEKSADGIFLVNKDGQIYDISSAGKEILGYEKDQDSTSKVGIEWIHPDDIEEIKNVIKEVASQIKAVRHTECRYRMPDGSYKWIEVTFNNLTHEPFIQAIVGNFRDITTRKKAEELQKKSEENYRQIFYNNPYPMWVFDHETRAFLDVNAAAIDKYGFSREEFLSMTILDIRPEEEIPKLLEVLDVHYQSGGARKEVMKHRDKSGKIILMEVTTYLIDFNGRKAMQTQVNDVTEIVKIQNEREIILNAIDKLRMSENLIDGLTAMLLCAREYIGWEYGEIWISDYTNEYFTLAACDYLQGEPGFQEMADRAPKVKQQTNKSIFDTKEKQEQAYWVEDINKDSLFQRGDITAKLGLYSAFSVPIRYQGKPISRIAFFSRKILKKDPSTINFIENICMQLAAEIEKKNTERVLNLFFKQSNDLLGLATFDGVFRRINNAFVEVLGYTEEQITSQHFINFVHPNDVTKTMEKMDELTQGKLISYFENRFITGNGDIKWFSWSCTPTVYENIFFASGRDITRQKKEEEQLRLWEFVITNSNDAVMITDASLFLSQEPEILYVNEAFTEITGYLPEDVIGKSPLILGGIHSDQNELNTLIETLQNRKNYEIEVLGHKKNGEELWSDFTFVPISDNTGILTHLIYIQRDITARKKNEAEKELLIKELTQNNTDLKQFSFITSHNLRSPLSNLMGIVDLIDTDSLENSTNALLFEKFKESTFQLNETINDLLSVLIIKDKVNIVKGFIGFENEFQKALASVSFMMKQANASLQIDFSEAPVVEFNRAYLESIILNLLTNSIKYRSPDRNLALKIKTTNERDFIKLYFSDNGIGMDMERYKDRIFGLYQRFHDLPDSKGLGLYIVHSQVNALGGHIAVESEVGVGTTFIISFKKFLKSRRH